ncbi:hypothetical protein DTO166G4_4535 [Paecilomyces variotii]|nr:hypothetical protein DTO166G4_4535 [Paecilomyces variotii]KAJ9240025.1 hypothetical protein DTO166G5_1890 [Paecilomyces variotii]
MAEAAVLIYRDRSCYGTHIVLPLKAYYDLYVAKLSWDDTECLTWGVCFGRLIIAKFKACDLGRSYIKSTTW